MNDKNKTKYAILGVLSLKPRSGYDIKKFCDRTIAHFWNENYGNIYPVLKLLESESLIEQDHAETEHRKKCYRITKKGLEEFRAWLALPVEFRPARSELLLKLSFASQMPKEKAVGMMESVRAKYAADMKQYRILEASYVNDEAAMKDPQFIYWLAPLRFGIEATAAALRWCDGTIELIKNSNPEA